MAKMILERRDTRFRKNESRSNTWAKYLLVHENGIVRLRRLFIGSTIMDVEKVTTKNNGNGVRNSRHHQV